ncbi:hypothetical protein OG462_10175 [Streptomyces sp. NBC_01077]|uniref:hypothetical protein n=1 Tax=Streptomyces sp. NBC_01077 TaxID=2903746 RepID=UPI0038660C48|nr:hypothetical protein OG462_10175 [Streptomyces sp. NBC_01077]
MDTGGESILASRWGTSWDIARMIFAAFFHDMPDWVRYPLLALGGAVLVHLALGRLRERFGAPSGEDEAVQANEADVR